MIKVEFALPGKVTNFSMLKPGDFFKVAYWSKQIYMKTQNSYIFITSSDPLDDPPHEIWYNESKTNLDFDVIIIDCVLKINN